MVLGFLIIDNFSVLFLPFKDRSPENGMGSADIIIIQESHSLLAAETGNGKTLCFLLPILQNIIRLKGSVR